MDQIIKQRFQVSRSNFFWGTDTVSTLIEALGGGLNTFRPHTETRGMKHFQYADTINGFSNLPQNWDSYNADVISQIAIDTAIKILNHLYNKGLLANGITVNVFPMRDGGIQFEFDGKNICAEIEITPNGEATFILFDDDGNIVNRFPIYELSEIPTLLEEVQYA